MIEQTRLRTALQTLVALAVGAFVVLMAWILVALLDATGSIERIATDSNDTTTKIRDTQKASRSLLSLIQDCTQPNGECYQQQEARDAEQAGAFNAAVIAARFCADQELPDVYTLRELTACVGKVLNGKGHK